MLEKLSPLELPDDELLLEVEELELLDEELELELELLLDEDELEDDEDELVPCPPHARNVSDKAATVKALNVFEN